MVDSPFSVPSACVHVSKHFGRRKGLHPLDWHIPATVQELASLRAAEVHHAWALKVRDRMREARVLQPSLEEEVRLGSRRLSKILCGQVHLSLDEALRIEARLGPILIGLRVPWTPVVDDELASKFPSAKALFTVAGFAEHETERITRQAQRTAAERG